MRALGLRPVSLPGADVSLLLRGLALPVAIGRPIVVARHRRGPRRQVARRSGSTSGSRARACPRRPAGSTARSPRPGRGPATPAPVNACLAALVDECAADASRAALFAGRPDRLAEAARRAAGGPVGTGPGLYSRRRGTLRRSCARS